ncbi:alpha-glucosidase [Elysia marginata]|uniref:Alpha-glucosidase n=1 Tax=Elysia marginata TaxID=1093978 RepID=A0AAV4EHF9_9GAST|nr:alpha-glucosidase [Elysia marginata]
MDLVLKSGRLGVKIIHFDIGGYTTAAEFGLVRTKELLLRSAEFAVFTSVFRTHEGNQISSNAQWYDAQITADFATQAKRFAFLADYSPMFRYRPYETFPKLDLVGNQKWVHIWSGKQVDGAQTLQVDAPLGQPPVYYCSGSQFASTFQKLRLQQPQGADKDDDAGDAGNQDGDGGQVWRQSAILVFTCFVSVAFLVMMLRG